MLIVSLLVGSSLAQSDISMATHWYNRANYNPASIARPGYMYIFSNIRQQWAGVSGSPQTINFQMSAFHYPSRSAFGFSLVSDRTGVTTSVNPMLTYAYRIADDDKNSAFSMGLSAGVFSRFFDGSAYEPEQENDQAISTNNLTYIRPDANLGMEYQSNLFIAGLSVTHVFSILSTETLYLNSSHNYGYLIFKITKPEFASYYLGAQVVNQGGNFYYEGNAMVRIKKPTGLNPGPQELFDLGISYRNTRLLTAFAGINISRNFRVAYTYGRSFTSGYNSNASHEIMLEYRIPFHWAACIPCLNNAREDWYR